MNNPYGTLHSATVDPAQATPMVAQYLEVKTQYPGVILFYRMGDFYETFFEDALTTARVLEITLTGRDAGQLGRIPMAGVPAKAVDSYLTKLLAQDFKVAVCEQMEGGDASAKLMQRKVTRVLSSGTITEQSLLQSDENNFLAAITASGTQWGLAHCDVTTGQFNVTELDGAQLLSELDRIRPVELLVVGRLQKSRVEPMARISFETETLVAQVPPEISTNYRCTPLLPKAFQTHETQSLLKHLMGVETLDGYGLDEKPLAKQAAGAIAHYLKENFPETPPVFGGLHLYSLDKTVTMNRTARQNLELLTTAKNRQYEGSLLWVLNRTATSMGTRLLRQWISRPLKDLHEIQTRLAGVGELVDQPAVRESMRAVLKDIYDIERLGTKLANATSQPRDLIALKQALGRLPELANLAKGLETFYLVRMQAFPSELFKLTALIDQAVDESPGISLKEGGLIKTGYHQELDTLRAVVRDHEAWLAQYETQERERTGIRSLKLSFNSAFGYFIEVTRAQSGQVPADYIRKQTLTNAERYTTDTLKTHEAQVLEAQGRQYDLEYTLFIELRQKLMIFAPVVSECAQRVAVLDVLQSLASVAVEQQYIRPVVDESLEITIQGGRHPVVEKILPLGRFVPNDMAISANAKEYKIPQLMIITGPNMAGKSTYMRQVAVITLMAQMGSFVPASYARIGLVDGIYTRVGAVDDLSTGQSTFMVEMSETAQILNGATRQSLILLDEVGRGTSTYDGVSIAWAVSEYLVNKTGCRALFATHYHELNTLETTNPKIQNFRVCVSETEGEIAFLHRVEPGAAQKSYGIQVARMAGVPNEVVTRASALLTHMQKKELAAINQRARGLQDETPQLSLF